MKPTLDIAGQIVIITGAAGTLCSSMAWALHDCGCKLALLDRNQEKAQVLADAINGKMGQAIAVGCDVLDRASLEAAKDIILAKFGRIDALINGAGGNDPQAVTKDEDPDSFFAIPTDAMERVVRLNLMGTVLPCQVFGKVMLTQRSGNIINIGSMAGVRPLTRVVGYSAAKAAVHNFTGWLSTYFAKAGCPGVRVNCIAPGFLLADQNRALMTNIDTGELTPRGESIIRQTPMGRFGDPEELTGILVYLLSPSASFVTGTVIPLDGGYSNFTL